MEPPEEAPTTTTTAPQQQGRGRRGLNSCQRTLLFTVAFVILSLLKLGQLKAYTSSDNNMQIMTDLVRNGEIDVNKNANDGSGVIFLCSVADLKEGQWVNVTYDLPPYIPEKSIKHDYTCPDLKPDQVFHTWEWEPNAVKEKGCTFSRFSNESYCQLMKNKTVAIVGDSISFVFYMSLSHLLGVPMAVPLVREGNAIRTSEVCGGSSTLVARRDFYLDTVQSMVDEYSPDVLVLNRGAHYKPDEELIAHLENTVFPQLHEWQSKCRANNKDCYLIWRTTVPGHPNCTSYTQPSTSIAEMEELVKSSAESNPDFNWHKFSHQNHLVLEAFSKQTNLTYEVMNSYNANLLRPDMHINGADCLHMVRR